MIDLSGKRALVCGATQGIGRAAAFMLARGGADVTLIARNAEALRETAEQITADFSRRADFVVADFRDPDAVRAAVAAHIENMSGGYHILLNNTGGPAAGPALTANTQDFLDAMQMHLLCNHALVQLLTPGMKQLGYGRIINIISTSVREPIHNLGVSNTTRAAVAGWAKTLSKELGPFGITVNNVLPGATRTGRITEIVRRQAAASQRSEDEVEAAMKATIPLGRFAEAEEIAAAVAFLASPLAGYISGVSLAVDGGRMASI